MGGCVGSMESVVEGRADSEAIEDRYRIERVRRALNRPDYPKQQTAGLIRTGCWTLDSVIDA